MNICADVKRVWSETAWVHDGFRHATLSPIIIEMRDTRRTRDVQTPTDVPVSGWSRRGGWRSCLTAPVARPLPSHAHVL